MQHQQTFSGSGLTQWTFAEAARYGICLIRVHPWFYILERVARGQEPGARGQDSGGRSQESGAERNIDELKLLRHLRPCFTKIARAKRHRRSLQKEVESLMVDAAQMTPHYAAEPANPISSIRTVSTGHGDITWSRESYYDEDGR